MPPTTTLPVLCNNCQFAFSPDQESKLHIRSGRHSVLARTTRYTFIKGALNKAAEHAHTRQLEAGWPMVLHGALRA